MARRKKTAAFFVDPGGVATPRAKGKINNSTRYRIFRAFDHKCCRCGKEVVRHRRHTSFYGSKPLGHVDHILPVARGGQHNEDNLQLLCETCNSQKGADFEG